MALAAADVIIFGIQAGIRLYGQARQVYIERTRERELVLPLPGLDHEPTASRARLYFSRNPQGRLHVVESLRLRELHLKAEQNLNTFRSEDPEGLAEYVELFVIYRAIDAGGRTEDGLLPADVVALNTIAQWRRGDTPHPTALQRIAGTLTEVGIDFFTQGPGGGVVSGNAPAKRLLRGVLASLDDHSFTTNGLDGVVERIFLATLDLIAQSPELVSGDARFQQLAAAVAGGLVADINARLEELPEEERLFAGDRLGELGELVFRSVLRHGGELVLANPHTFLGLEGEGQAALVSRVGTTILDTIAPPEDGELDLGALVTAETLDGIVKSALAVVAEHPELLGLEEDHDGLRQILQEVAAGIAAETRQLGPDLFPEIARLTLERTAANLDLVWRVDDAEKHLLVTAVKTLLGEISQPADGDTRTWRLSLGKSQLLNVVEAVLDEVADNPALVTRRIEGKPALRVALTTAIERLAAEELDRLSAESAAEILRLSLQAAAQRFDFLEPIAGDDEKLALEHVIDAIFSAAFDDDPANQRAAWALAQASTLQAMVGVALEALANHGANEASVRALQEVVAETVARLNERSEFTIDGFLVDLEDRLAA